MRAFHRMLPCGIALALIAMACGAQAQQAYPSKPVRVISPAPAGGNADAVARTIAERLSAALGQPFVVENKPGAAGNIGTEMAASAPADGYTLVEIITANTINATLYPSLSFDLSRDFVPVGLAATLPLILVVHPSVPASSVAELIAYAKKNPGKLNYASAGSGTGGHVAGELFKTMAGLDVQHVPYKGATPAVTDLIGGRVDFFFDGMPSALPHVQTGRLKVLAITTKTRSPTIPNVPTVAEAGLPGFEVSLWLGFMAPAGTPMDIVNRLNKEINDAVASASVRERFARLGLEPLTATPQEFGALIRSETAKWAEMIKRSGARVD
jgi:tripartite-type tricarboxylate transporter receptor subunit TctC